MKEYFYYYRCPDESIIRIRGVRRPSRSQQSRTWVVREYNDSQWRIPCFPEITWGKLQTFDYIGKVISNKINLIG